MLTLERYNIKLQRVTYDDIELIRKGRNLEKVRLNHVYQKVITAEEQKKWFEKINNPEHYFFVIISKGKKVGVLFIKDFYEGLTRCNCGIFIWDESALNSRVPIFTVFIGLDFFFSVLGITYTETFVLKNNLPAIKMDKFFGFSFEDVPEENYYKVFMDEHTYFANQSRLLKFAARVIKNKDQHALKVSGSPSPLNFPQINELLTKS